MRKDYTSIITSHLLTGKLNHTLTNVTNVIKIREAKYQHLDFLSQMVY